MNLYEETNETEPVRELPAKNSEAGCRGSMRSVNGLESILIAEDEEQVTAALKIILEKVGYRVFIADNGREAVELFRRHREIALVLCDVEMPGQNGKETVMKIRAMNPDVRAIFMSGYSVDIIRNQGMIGENDELIIKPFTINGVLGKIREQLDRN